MANKPVISFGFQFEGDGTSTSVDITLAMGPVAFFEVGGAGGSPSLLSGVTSGVPTGIKSGSLAVTGGLTISSSSLVAGIVTVHFSSAPAAGTIYTVSGVLEF